MNNITIAVLALVLCLLIALNITMHNIKKSKEKHIKQEKEAQKEKLINDILIELKKNIKEGNVSDLLDAAIKLGEAKRK